jgi:hypothetical protein
MLLKNPFTPLSNSIRQCTKATSPRLVAGQAHVFIVEAAR